MNLFGVGPAEAGLVFVIALIVVGPQRFPEIMRQAGRWYRVARAYSNEVMKDVRTAVDEIEREVKAETDDLKAVGALTDLRGDLKEAREAVDGVGKDTKAAAAGPATPITPPVTKAPASPSTPKSTAAPKPSTLPPTSNGAKDDGA